MNVLKGRVIKIELNKSIFPPFSLVRCFRQAGMHHTHLIIILFYNSINGSQLRCYKVRSTVLFVDTLNKKKNKGAWHRT